MTHFYPRKIPAPNLPLFITYICLFKVQWSIPHKYLLSVLNNSYYGKLDIVNLVVFLGTVPELTPFNQLIQLTVMQLIGHSFYRLIGESDIPKDSGRNPRWFASPRWGRPSQVTLCTSKYVPWRENTSLAGAHEGLTRKRKNLHHIHNLLRRNSVLY